MIRKIAFCLTATLLFFIFRSEICLGEAPKILPEKEKAVRQLLESLTRLGATPERSAEIRRLAQAHRSDVTEEIRKLRSEIQNLKDRIRKLEEKRCSLENRAKVYPVALELLSEACPPQSCPASSESSSCPVSETQEVSVKPDRNPSGDSFFAAKVAPILCAKCYSCHGPEKQKADLRLDSRKSILKGSEYGPVFNPDQPEKSVLLQVIRHTGETKMPPKEKLPQEEIDILAEWIRSGIPWPQE